MACRARIWAVAGVAELLLDARRMPMLSDEIFIMVDQGKVILIGDEFFVAKLRLQASVDPRDMALVAAGSWYVCLMALLACPRSNGIRTARLLMAMQTLEACFRMVSMIKLYARPESV